MFSPSDLLVTLPPQILFYKKHMDNMHAFTEPGSVYFIKNVHLIISSCWLSGAAGDITMGHFMC